MIYTKMHLSSGKIYSLFTLTVILIIFGSLNFIQRNGYYDILVMGNAVGELKKAYSDSVPGTGTCPKSNFYGDRIIDEDSFRKLLNECRNFDKRGKINRTELSDKKVEISCEPRTLQFLHHDRPLIALASFPGSGNSWTRELLESLTGIYTGSMYYDRMSNFVGSKRCPSGDGVFIIKTHSGAKNAPGKKCKNYTKKELDIQRAILIIRDPYDAMIADYNRRHGGKIIVANLDAFQSDDWKNFVQKRINNWYNLIRHWVQESGKPVYVLVYEELKSNTYEELFNIANFIDEKVTYTTVFCTVMVDKDQYLRVSKPDWLNKYDLYDEESRNIINSKIYQIMTDFTDRKDLISILMKYIL